MELTPNQEEKRRLRREMKKKLAALSRMEKSRLEGLLHQTLFGWPAFIAARRVHCYVSQPEEPDTQPIFDACWEMGKETWIPVVDGPGPMKLAHRRPGEPLAPGLFQLRRPLADTALEAGGPTTPPLDLILLPGLAFTRGGARLGLGKGYYDRFLSQLGHQGKKPLLAALLFERQLVEAIPLDPWDIPMDYLLFPEKVFLCDHSENGLKS